MPGMLDAISTALFCLRDPGSRVASQKLSNERDLQINQQLTVENACRVHYQ